MFLQIFSMCKSIIKENHAQYLLIHWSQSYQNCVDIFFNSIARKIIIYKVHLRLPYRNDEIQARDNSVAATMICVHVHYIILITTHKYFITFTAEKKVRSSEKLNFFKDSTVQMVHRWSTSTVAAALVEPWCVISSKYVKCVSS